MHKEFEEVFDVLELQRQAMLHSVQHLSEEEFNRAPMGKWSVAQILSHIVAGERLSTLYIRKKMQGAAQTVDSGWWEAFKFFLLRISQRFPGLKYKAPKKVVEMTEIYHNFASLVQEWNTSRHDLKSVLEKIQDDYVRRRIFKHPRAGYLSVRQGLLFLREHIIHHTPQIKKLVNQR